MRIKIYRDLNVCQARQLLKRSDTARLKGEVGIKGYNLLRLRAEGSRAYEVPRFFILTADGVAEVKKKFALIRQNALYKSLIAEDQIFEYIIKNIHDLKRAAGQRPTPFAFSIRSSVPETLPGILKTILNVTLDENSGSDSEKSAWCILEGAIHAEADNIERIKNEYGVPGQKIIELIGKIDALCAAHESSLGRYLPLALIFQEMRYGNRQLTDHDGAGVITAQNGRMTINYCRGEQGDRAVDMVTVDSYRSLPKALRNRLRSIGREIGGQMPEEYQVEFTIENGRIYVLQARPFDSRSANHLALKELKHDPAARRGEFIAAGRLLPVADLDLSIVEPICVHVSDEESFREQAETLLKIMYRGKVRAIIMDGLKLNFNSHFRAILATLGIATISAEKTDLAGGYQRVIGINERGWDYLIDIPREVAAAPVNLSREEMDRIELLMRQKEEEIEQAAANEKKLCKEKRWGFDVVGFLAPYFGEYNNYCAMMMAAEGKLKIELDYKRHLLHNIIKNIMAGHQQDGSDLFVEKCQREINEKIRKHYYVVGEMSDDAPLDVELGEDCSETRDNAWVDGIHNELQYAGSDRFDEQLWKGHKYYMAISGAKVAEASNLVSTRSAVSLGLTLRKYQIYHTEYHHMFGKGTPTKRNPALDAVVFYLLSNEKNALEEMAKLLQNEKT